MLREGLDLPPGFRLQFHEVIDSTNAEALRLAAGGEEGGLWIWAGSQASGRGRAGRNWTSPTGNLYASLLLRPSVSLATASQLSLLAGVAAFDAISALAATQHAGVSLQLKWPNDVLAGSAKLGGILLESTSSGSDSAPAVVIGMGINTGHAPNDLGRPATSLMALGMPIAPVQAMAALAWSMADWLSRWDSGRCFDEIREAWLTRAQPAGAAISVRQGTSLVTGRFLGIDEAGALLLQTEGGEKTRITAGDVSFGGAEAQGT
jgi:BirA family transcriptional regulator, biotin operon repressor / biotin---[acetyl-CoA-carboxylase] ligase